MVENRTETAIEAFKRYVNAFEQLDPRGIVAFYHEPALFISPQGVVNLPTGAQVEHFFIPVMADLKTQGYSSSEFPQLGEHYLSGDLAIVGGVGIWRKATVAELRRFGLTYTFCRKPQSWQIVVAAIHDPESALSLP